MYHFAIRFHPFTLARDVFNGKKELLPHRRSLGSKVWPVDMEAELGQGPCRTGSHGEVNRTALHGHSNVHECLVDGADHRHHASGPHTREAVCEIVFIHVHVRDTHRLGRHCGPTHRLAANVPPRDKHLLKPQAGPESSDIVVVPDDMVTAKRVVAMAQCLLVDDNRKSLAGVDDRVALRDSLDPLFHCVHGEGASSHEYALTEILSASLPLVLVVEPSSVKNSLDSQGGKATFFHPSQVQRSTRLLLLCHPVPLPNNAQM